MKVLRGRTALVTGAASGIGRAIALRLAQEGVNLVLTDRDETGLAQTAEAARRADIVVSTVLCDLAQPAEITQTLDRLFANAPLHIVVNCAGLTWFGLQHGAGDAAWRSIMAVNLLAPMQITTELIPVLLRADEAHIVNIASFLGVVPGRKLAAYSASKYGLVGFSLAMRSDYMRSGFGLSVVCPGFVKTPMLALQGAAETPAKLPTVPAWLSTTPEHIAEVTIDVIKRDRGLVVVTALAKLFWRINRLAPGLVDYLNREGWRIRGRLAPPGKPDAN
jgi:3-oxoacyl-[acyl-carrier protein] reductase